MIPRGDVPRSTFLTTHSLKTTFNADYLVPIYTDEVLPGDSHQGEATIFARLATPVFPLMDNIHLETFFFFVPNRLVWDNWKKMMGERANPSDSISYTVPQATSPATGYDPCSIFDYMGLPTNGMLGGTISHNVLPLRGYYLIWNEWFRDQNLQNSLAFSTGDATVVGSVSFALQKRNKRHDYFTSALPWPLKGGSEIALFGNVPIKGISITNNQNPTTGTPANTDESNTASAGSNPSGWAGYYTNTTHVIQFRATSPSLNADPWIYADMGSSAGSTVNQIRLAVQTQRLLERDARSGTRYTELLRAHFGVTPEDVRLQRPEYIGGGRTAIQTNAIPQTSVDRDATDNSVNNPLGSLGAAATFNDQHRFSYNATEHGFIIGLVNVTGEITYQQGLHRMWTRQTRYDYYWPSFAHLGEQAIRVDEIYVRGLATDDDVFGYQERWAEYRHRPSRVTGMFKTTTIGNIGSWHVAQHFSSTPSLNSSFIEQNTPMERVLSAAEQAADMQVLFDSVFRIKSTRPLPMYSVPGLMDRF